MNFFFQDKTDKIQGKTDKLLQEMEDMKVYIIYTLPHLINLLFFYCIQLHYCQLLYRSMKYMQHLLKQLITKLEEQ